MVVKEVIFICFLLPSMAWSSSSYTSLTAEWSFSTQSGIIDNSDVSSTLLKNVKDFIAEEANRRCDSLCFVSNANVTVSITKIGGNSSFMLTSRIDTIDAASCIRIAAEGDFFPTFVYETWNEENVTVTQHVFVQVLSQSVQAVEGVSIRPAFCGDGAISVGEQCDDYNVNDGDGCSSTCQLEAGFMCPLSWRAENSRDTPGFAVNVETVAGISTYTITSEKEECTGPGVCEIGGLWQPEIWPYATNTSLPPRGYYCTDFCAQFPVPTGLMINVIQSDTLDTCALKDQDECMFGLAECAFHAYCENYAYNATTKKGYNCFCDRDYFPTDTNGGSCSTDGIEVAILIAGIENYNSGVMTATDVANMNSIRENFIDAFMSTGLFKPRMTKEIMLEAVHDFPPELVRELSEVEYARRNLWQIKVRASSQLMNLEQLVSSSFFSDLAQLDPVLSDSSIPPAFMLYKESRCSNEINRVCTADSDCLYGGSCNADTPAVSVSMLHSGGSAAPVFTESLGMQIISLAYDNTRTGWNARVRYKPSENAVSLLYLPKIGLNPTGEQMSVFVPDEFPCLPFGTGTMQQRRDNTVCCMSKINRDFTTTTAFSDYISDPNSILAQEIARQGKCLVRGDAPSNHTNLLLNETLDFVTGTLSGMSRSTATLDPVRTIGYQDILLFLAYEDMVEIGGITREISGGNSVRFVIGMAHLQTTSTQFLSTSVSTQEITSDITNTYTFSTTGSTKFTFIQDVTTDLIEVENKTSGDTLKFVRVMVGVPPDVTHDDMYGLLPHNGILARIGYTKDSAPALQTYYPCINMYTGTPKMEIDKLLADQAYCAFQDGVCKPLGPAPVNQGGLVSFILPLQGDAWDKETAGQSLIRKKLFLDFILSIKDESGKRVLTNVETQTSITSEAINSFCTEAKLESSIDDMFTVDLFLGLANSTQDMQTSLLSAYDITKSGNSVNLQRNVSSKVSNVLTMVINGKDDVFNREYSRDYSIEVEDMVTVYFLSMEKKEQVDALIAAGLAVKEELIQGSVSSINLRATEQLLALCPLQAIKEALGCITRYEIKSRSLDLRTNSIVNIAPETVEDYATVVDNAGLWTQYSLGDSEFSNNLGSQHADTINQIYGLNRRYKKGFLVSPVVPWRATDLRAEGFSSSISLAQYSVSFVLLAFDANIGISYEPVVQVSIPGSLPIPVDEFEANLELQSALSSAYAQGLGLPESSVKIDPESIESVVINTTNSSSARRLLEVQYTTKYECIIMFYELETTDSGGTVAEEKASAIVDLITAQESPVADILFEKVSKAVAQKCKDCKLPKREDIKPPPTLRETIKSTIKDSGKCRDAEIAVNLTSIGGGIATCDSRTIDGVKYNIGPRGPLTDSEWQSIGGAYEILSGSRAFSEGRAAYDFCGNIPVHWEAESDQAQEIWDSLKAQFSRCCLCKATPKIAGTKQDYVHEYSWGYSMSAIPLLPEWKQYDENGTKTLINPQISTFRDTTVAPAKISQNNLPSSTWKFEKKNGKIKFVGATCDDGFGLIQAQGGCETCPVGTFRRAEDTDYISCRQCADEFGSDSQRTTKFSMQSTGPYWGSPCTCKAGYYSWAERRDNVDDTSRFKCAPCPANTYKDAVSELYSDCLACPDNTISKAGSSSIADCRAPTTRNFGEYEREDHVYDYLLGLVSHAARVQSSWTDPRPQYQDNSRRCSLSVDGEGLDCPGLSHETVYSKVVTPSSVNNEVKLNEFGINDEVSMPGLLMFAGDPISPARYTMAMFPAADKKLAYDASCNCLGTLPDEVPTCADLQGLGAIVWYLPPTMAVFYDWDSSGGYSLQGSDITGQHTMHDLTIVMKFERRWIPRLGTIYTFSDYTTQFTIRIKASSQDEMQAQLQTSNQICYLSWPNVFYNVNSIILEYDNAAKKFSVRGFDIAKDSSEITSTTAIYEETTCGNLSDTSTFTIDFDDHANHESRFNTASTQNMEKTKLYGMVWFNSKIEQTLADSILAAFDDSTIFLTSDSDLIQYPLSTDHFSKAALDALTTTVCPAPPEQSVPSFFAGSLYDRSDLKNTAKYVSLSVRKSYAGPRFAGFEERILAGGQEWPAETKINFKFRLDVPAVNLSSTTVRVVAFITNVKLTSNTDWQWIICDSVSGGPQFCNHENDPDNPAKPNFRNGKIVSGTMFRLHATSSCFTDMWWLDDCLDATMSPLQDRHDDVYEWVPFLNSIPNPSDKAYYLYTTFHYGETQQCVAHGCVEADMYANLQQHISAAYDSSEYAEIKFLPGTEITVQTKTTGTTYQALMNTSLGLLSAEKYKNPIPPEGTRAIDFLELDITTATRPCSISEDGLSVACNGVSYSDAFTESILTNKAFNLGEYHMDFVNVTSFLMCCDADMTPDCSVEKILCHDGFRNDTAHSVARETYERLNGFSESTKDFYDLLYKCGPNEDEVCACSSSPQSSAAVTRRKYPHQGPGIEACGDTSTNTILPASMCAESGLQVSLLSDSNPIEQDVVYTMIVSDATLGTSVDTQDTHFGQWFLSAYGAWPTAECTQPRITETPCKISRSGQLDDFVFAVAMEVYRTFSVNSSATTLRGRMSLHETLIRVYQSDSSKPTVRPISSHYNASDFTFFNALNGCGQSCSDSLMAGLDVHGELAPVFVLHANRHRDHMPPCACDNRSTVPITIAGYSDSSKPQPDQVLTEIDLSSCFATGTCASQCGTECSGLILESSTPTAVESIVYSGVYESNVLEVERSIDGSGFVPYTTLNLLDTTLEKSDPTRVYDLPVPFSSFESCSGVGNGCGFLTFSHAKQMAENTRSLEWVIASDSETCSQACDTVSAVCDENTLYHIDTKEEAVAVVANSPLHASTTSPHDNVVGSCTDAPLSFQGGIFTFNDCPDFEASAYSRASSRHGVSDLQNNLLSGNLCRASLAAQKLCPCSKNDANSDSQLLHRLPTAQEVKRYEKIVTESLSSIDVSSLSAWYTFDDSLDLGSDSSTSGNGVSMPASSQFLPDAVRGNGAVKLIENVQLTPVFNPSSNGFTVSFWLNVRQWAQLYGCLRMESTTDPSGLSWGLSYQTSTDVRIFMSNGTAHSEDLANIFVVGEWVHLVWSISPTGSWAIYQNGVLRLYYADFKPFNFDFRVSFLNDVGYTESYIDDLRLYERELHGADVVAIFKNHEALVCDASCTAAVDSALQGWIPITDADVVGGSNFICASTNGCTVNGTTYGKHTLASEAYPEDAAAATPYEVYRVSSEGALSSGSRIFEIVMFTDSLCTEQIDSSRVLSISSGWSGAENIWDGNLQTGFDVPDSVYATTIDVTFNDPIILGCVVVYGMGVKDDDSGVNRHNAGFTIQAQLPDASWTTFAAAVPYSDATTLVAPGYLGNVVQHPLTALSSLQTHLIKVKIPKAQYWKLTAKNNEVAASAQILNVALCATKGCTLSPTGAGLCPRDSLACYSEESVANDCTQTMQKELMQSSAHEQARMTFSSLQSLDSVSQSATNAPCFENYYLDANNKCVQCPSNTFSTGGAAIGCVPLQCPENEYYEVDEWVIGEVDATCQETCVDSGKQCDAAMQSSIHSMDDFKNFIFEMLSVCGEQVKANSLGADVFQAPVSCAPFSVHWLDSSFTQLASSCDANEIAGSRPLCRCHTPNACKPCPLLHSSPAGSYGSQACVLTKEIAAPPASDCSVIELDGNAALPYVMYDLGKSKTIDRIQIKPRGRCQHDLSYDLWDELINYEVYVSNSDTLDSSAIMCASYESSDNVLLQYEPGVVLSKTCMGTGRYVYLKFSTEGLLNTISFDEFSVIPASFSFDESNRYKWSGSMDHSTFMTLWNSPLPLIETANDNDTTLDFAEYGNLEYFDYQVDSHVWPNGHVSDGKTWKQWHSEGIRKPLFPPGAEQPLVAVFASQEAFVQFRLDSTDAVGGVVIQPGPRFSHGDWPSHWTYSWPGRVRVYSSMVEDFDAVVSSAVLLLNSTIPYEYDARGIPVDKSYTIDFPRDAPVSPSKFLRVVLNRCEDTVCMDNNVNRLEVRVGFTDCVFKCTSCCEKVGAVASEAFSWLSSDAGQNVSKSLFYAAASHCKKQTETGMSFELCLKGECTTDAFVLAVDSQVFKLGDVNGLETPRLQVRKGATTTISWPENHPVVVSSIQSWGGSRYEFSVTGSLSTTITVPVDAEIDRLFYFCENHNEMPVGIIDVLEADGMPLGDSKCAIEKNHDFSAQEASFTFEPVSTSNLVLSNKNMEGQNWFRVHHPFESFAVTDGHLFESDPQQSSYWKMPFAENEREFLRQQSANVDVVHQFVPWGIGTLHTNDATAFSAEFPVRSGFMGPGGVGFVQKLHMPSGHWDSSVTVEAELHLAVKARFENDENLVQTWKDANRLHLISFVTDKKLNDSLSSVDFNWIVCGQLGKHLVKYPGSFSELLHGHLVGKQPPESLGFIETRVSFKTDQMFASQNGILPDIPGFADPNCKNNSEYEDSACQSRFSPLTVALGYPRCDLSAPLDSQDKCVYTVKDVLDRYFYSNPSRFWGGCKGPTDYGAKLWYIPPSKAYFNNFEDILSIFRPVTLDVSTNGGFTVIFKNMEIQMTNNIHLHIYDPMTQTRLRLLGFSSSFKFEIQQSESCTVELSRKLWALYEVIITYDAASRVLYMRRQSAPIISHGGGVYTTGAIETEDVQTTCTNHITMQDIDLAAAHASGHSWFRTEMGRVYSGYSLNMELYGMVIFDRKLDVADANTIMAGFDMSNSMVIYSGVSPSTDHTQDAALLSINLACIEKEGTDLDKLESKLDQITRNLIQRTPDVKNHQDSPVILVQSERASVCHMDLYGAQTENKGRFLPVRDLSQALNPATGMDDQGQIPDPGYHSMACSVPMPSLTDAAAVETYLQTTSVGTALNLFSDKHDCICGIVANVYNGDSQMTVKIEQTSAQMDAGHEFVFVTPLQSEDVSSGHVLARGYVEPTTDLALFEKSTATNHFTSKTTKLPADYEICSDKSDPDDSTSANEKNPHVLDGVVIPLGAAPQPVFEPVKEEDASAKPGGTWAWRRDGCSYVKPHITVTHALSTFETTLLSIAERGHPSVSDVGVIDSTSVPSGLEWFFPPKTLDAAGLPQFSVECTKNELGFPSHVPCSYSSPFGGLSFSDSDSFLTTAFDHQFVDLVFLPAKGWTYVWFAAKTDAPKQVYVRELIANVNMTSSRHRFVPADIIIGGREGVGSASEKCPSGNRYNNEMGVLTWKPEISQTASEFFLYTMFMVGESEACHSHGCDELAVLNKMTEHLEGDVRPKSTTPLVLMQGSRVGLKVSPEPVFVMKAGCLVVESTTTDNPNSYQITFSTNDFAQNLEDFETCSACVHGLCPVSSAPCQYYDLESGNVYYSVKVYFNSTSEDILILSQVDGAFVGTASLTAGMPEPETARTVSWSAGQKLYTTYEQKCADESSRRRALLSKPSPKTNHMLQGKKIKSIPRWWWSARSKSPVPAVKKDKVKLNVHRPRTRRKLLSIGSDALGMTKTSSDSQMQREITSIDGNREMANAVCGGGHNSICDLVRMEVQIPIHQYCEKEGDIMREIEKQIAAMNPNSAYKVTAVSVYRPVFFSACFQSSIYMRRLLTDTRKISVLAAIQSTENVEDCLEASEQYGCQIVLDTSGLKIHDLPLWGIETAIPVTGNSVGYRLCYGDESCDSFIEISNTTTSIYKAKPKNNSPSGWVVAAIVLGVFLFISLVIILFYWRRGHKSVPTPTWLPEQTPFIHPQVQQNMFTPFVNNDSEQAPLMPPANMDVGFLPVVGFA